MVFDNGGLGTEHAEQTGIIGEELGGEQQSGIVSEGEGEKGQIDRDEKLRQTGLRLGNAKVMFQRSMEQLQRELTLAKKL